MQKRTKKDKVRPILVNKDVISPENVIDNLVVDVPAANHFEKLHPKDEFELMHINVSCKTMIVSFFLLTRFSLKNCS